jgi:hypothetical protein
MKSAAVLVELVRFTVLFSLVVLLAVFVQAVPADNGAAIFVDVARSLRGSLGLLASAETVEKCLVRFFAVLSFGVGLL